MGWGFKRMNYFSFNRGVERSTFLKQKYLNAPHVSDRGKLHVVQTLSSFTTIHKIWQAGFDHGSYCYRKNIVLPSCSKTRTKQIVMFILKQKQKRINRRRDACQQNCSEQHSRFPLDTKPLALPARQRYTESLVRGRNSLNTRRACWLAGV